MSTNEPIPTALAKALGPEGNRASRAFTVDRASVNVESRTVQLAFASETAYERYWGIEILDCTPQSMRGGRLNSGANLLIEHCPDDVVGVVESVTIGADRVARALVRFGKSADAEEVFQDVIDGIRRNVSVGYMIHKALLVQEVDGVSTYRVTDWEPFEISLVAIPADPTVGVGRSLTTTETPPPNILQEKSIMPEATPATAAPVAAAAPQVAVVATRNHAQEITTIAASIPGGAELAMRAIQAGMTVEQFQQEAIRAMSNKPLPTADIGMTQSDTKRYSLMRAINAMASRDPSAMQAAAFEFECSRAVAKLMGKDAQGFYVPYDVMAAKRDLTVGSAASAGNLKATNLLADSFIELLRNKLVVGNLGCTYLTGLVGDIELPRQTGTGTTYWLAEQGAPTKSDQTTDKVAMSPKTVGAKTIIGRKLRQQASLDVESMVQNDLNNALAVEIQRVIFNGSGASNQPRGVRNVVGVGSVAGGTNGLAPTWSHIVDLETAIANANADVANLAYVTNSKVRGKLKKTFVDAGSNAERVWDRAAQPLNGYNALVTNSIPSNLTKGSSSGVCSSIIFGNWADLLIGMWGGLDILVDPYGAGGDAGDISIRMLQDIDVAVRHPESFAVMDDALTV